MKRFALSTTAAFLALAFGGVFAQTGAGPAGGSAGTTAQTAPAAQAGTGTRNAETRKDDSLARADRQFMQKAAESGKFEVEAAQLAASKASDPAVKSYAQMLVDHHTKANAELTQLANSKKVELPAAPPRAMRQDVEKLGKAKPDELDRQFVREIGIKAHEKDIKLFEKASKDAKDPELKAFAAKTLPTLKEHLAAAQKLPQAGKGGNSAAMGNTGNSGGTGSGNTPAGASTRTGGGSGANKTGS